jgi:molybdate transport system substrate-binding protein
MQLRKVFFSIIMVFAASPALAQSTIQVSAAISLKPLLEMVAAEYAKSRPKVQVVFNFAGTPELVRQIKAGAPADIFISADEKLVIVVEATKRLVSRFDFVRNTLVLIARDKAKSIANGESLADKDVKKIALMERSSAAGRYAYEYLKSTSLLPKVDAKLVYMENVRAVFTVVAKGNADAGFVYLTDVKAFNANNDVRNVAIIDPKSHGPIVYPACLLKNPLHVNPEASAFFEYLKTENIRSLASAFGFQL